MNVVVTTVTFLMVVIVSVVPLLASLAASFTQTISFETRTGIHWTLNSYHLIFHPPPSVLSLGAALQVSNQLGVWVASGTVVIAYVLARRLTSTRDGFAKRITDVVLLGSVAIPGVVLGVGYILFYNQGIIAHHVIALYQTMPLLVMGLIASAVPGQSRLLIGPVSQIQSSMADAARVHGAKRWRTWRTASLPMLSRTLTWAWVLTFTKTISELAVAQMLLVPGHEPVSVLIETTLGTVFAPIGTAATVLVLGEMLGVIAVVLGVYRLVSPKGWRRIGQAVEL
jgi:iron(III) transport system permease protein